MSQFARTFTPNVVPPPAPVTLSPGDYAAFAFLAEIGLAVVTDLIEPNSRALDKHLTAILAGSDPMDIREILVIQQRVHKMLIGAVSLDPDLSRTDAVPRIDPHNGDILGADDTPW